LQIRPAVLTLRDSENLGNLPHHGFWLIKALFISLNAPHLKHLYRCET